MKVTLADAMATWLSRHPLAEKEMFNGMSEIRALFAEAENNKRPGSNELKIHKIRVRLGKTMQPFFSLYPGYLVAFGNGDITALHVSSGVRYKPEDAIVTTYTLSELLSDIRPDTKLWDKWGKVYDKARKAGTPIGSESDKVNLYGKIVWKKLWHVDGMRVIMPDSKFGTVSIPQNWSGIVPHANGDVSIWFENYGWVRSNQFSQYINEKVK